MSEQPHDYELLRDFVRQKSEPAFAALVRRHVDLVYGTAVRKVEDQGAAEEIAQNVFNVLARKAWQFAPDDSLPAWLHRTTLLETKQWLRGELRRRRREQTAAELGTTMRTTDEQPALRALVPLLDEALLSLREKDRSALLLRYYENRSLREIGISVGISEGGAQKRLNSALEHLAQFFQRRGFRTATVAATTAALQHSATAAPVSLAATVTQAAIQFAPPLTGGLATFAARFAGLTKTQTTIVCLVIAAVPSVWQWSQAHAAQRTAAFTQSQLLAARSTEDSLVGDADRLRAESDRLDAALAEAEQAQARNGEGMRKIQDLRTQIQHAFADGRHWPDDLPYVRVPKSVVGDLDLMSKFGRSGQMSDEILELLALTPDEKVRSEAALSNYWHGAGALTAMRAYETNSPTELPPGRVAKTVIVPPLGQDLKDLGQRTRAELTEILGAEREKILFGDWDQGAIQLFWPGNLWKISEEPQKFIVWTEPTADTAGQPKFGMSWTSKLGGTSTEGTWDQAKHGIQIFPEPIITQFFEPWLRQMGITNLVAYAPK